MKLSCMRIIVALLCFISVEVKAQTGSGLNFDGDDDYVSFSQDLSSVNDFTYEAWVNLHNNYQWARILDFGNGPGHNIFLTTSYSGTLYPRFVINIGEGEQVLTSETMLPLNTWSHIAVTIGGGVATMYINGVMAGQNTTFGYTPASLGATVNNYIGKSQYAEDAYYNGDLDEVRIWNVARTQAQIAADMNCDVALQPGLLAYYRFDEGAANGDNTLIPMLYDYTGGGRCGTFNNMQLSSGPSSNYVAGAISSCNVIAAPTAGGVSGNTALCPAGTLTLIATIAGGTWSSAATSVATISATGAVTALMPGNATIVYTLGCIMSAVVVTVNAVPLTGGNIYNFAGNGVLGYTADNIPAMASGLSAPVGTAVDNAGNVYIAELFGARVRKVNTSGVITTVAGTGFSGYSGDGGPATAANLTGVAAMAFDNAGNLYIAESGGNRIRKVNTAGIISTFAGTGAYGYSGDGGPATAAVINGPAGMVFDVCGNMLFADYSNNCIRKIDTAGIITTKAGVGGPGGYNGDGPALTTLMSYPSTLALNDSGEILFTDAFNQRVRKVSHGNVVTLAGNDFSIDNGDGGNAVDASLNVPFGIAYRAGNIYVSSTYGNRIRKIDASGIITTIAGDGTMSYSGDNGPATAAEIANPYGITADANGTIYVCDLANNRVRRIYGTSTINGTKTLCAGTTTTLTSSEGGGTWSSAGTGVATVGSTGLLSAVSAGTATISYSIGGICGNKIITAVVTVNASPAAVSGPVSLAMGSTAVYSNASSGGLWSSSDSTKLTINALTGDATVVANGTAVVSYTLPGSCSRTKTVSISGTPMGPITGNLSICMGATSVLSTTSAPGLQWSSSNTAVAIVSSSSGIVTPVSTGTAVITFTAATGGNITAVVTVNAAPGIIAGAVAVCSGATAALSATTSGGMWTSSNTAKATIGSSSGVVTGIAAGTAIITYALATGCKTLAVITVNTIPAAITGAAAVCVGSTSALADATTGGSWSTADAGIASVSTTGVVTGNSAGVTNISYTAGSGCAAFVAVTVGVVSGITGNTGMCVGSSTILAHTSAGGTWFSGNTAVATVAGTGVVTGVAAGTASITYTIGSGCRTATTVTVNATIPNITGPTSVCAGSTITLTNSATGGTWTTSSTLAAVDATAGVVTGISAGSATITYAIATGCSKTYNITVKALPAAISGTLSVCSGAATNLTDATTGGLSWTSSTPAVATINGSGVVMGMAAGTTTITYTLTSGCYTTSDVTVTASPAAISGVAGVCAGATTTLSSATTGGTWVSNAATIATIGSGSGVVTGVAASITTITYNLNGCRALTNVTVYALPSAISGAAAVCTGSTSQLGATPSGGTWSSSAAGIAGVGTAGLVTGMGTGSATISYVLGTGCGRTAVVTVSAVPVISGTTAICTGGAVTLSATATGGSWTSSTTSVATIGGATGMLSGNSAGSATITYTTSASCRATAAVTVNNAPAMITGATAVCAGATATLANATGGGTWSSSNTGLATVDATGVVSGIASGAVNISYTTTAGCYRVKSMTVGNGSTTLSGNTGLCTGGSTVFSASTSGESWTSSNTGVASVGSSSGLVTGVAAGTAIITFTPYSSGGSAGCLATRVVTVATAPAVAAITGPSAVAVGSSISLADATAAGVWSSSNTSSATVSSAGVVTGMGGAAVSISYTVTNGVCQVSAMKSLSVVASRDAVALSHTSVEVYPNPTAGYFTVAMPVEGTIAIYTLEGKQLMQQVIAAGNNSIQLPDTIAAGIFMCHIAGADGSNTMVRLVYAR